jgi:hypothetical protein
VDEQGLGQTRYADQQDVTPTNHAYEDLPDDLILPNNDLSNLLSEGFKTCVELIYGVRRDRLFH